MKTKPIDIDPVLKVPVNPADTSTVQSDTISISSSFHNRFTYKYKKFLVLLPILILFIIGIAIGSTMNHSQDFRGKAALTGPILLLSPATKTGNIGDTFTVGIILNTNSASVSAAELHLTYDPTAIQVLGFTQGTPLQVLLLPETHANGTIAVTLGGNPTALFHGDNFIGRLQIKILAAKQSTISFMDSTRVMTLDKDTNALISSSGIQITGVIPPPNQSPTLTPTPTSPPKLCHGVTFILDTNPKANNKKLIVNIDRNNATSCRDNWSYVSLLIDTVPFGGVAPCYADGTKCDTGYHAFLNSGNPGVHTVQFVVNQGSCLCDTTTFTTQAAPTPIPTSAGPLTITNVQATDITQNTATIRWNLSNYGTGQVKYGPTTAYGLFSTAETSFSWNYHIQSLSNLTPNTLYHYRTFSSDKTGQETTSDDYTFTTLPLNQTPTPTP